MSDPATIVRGGAFEYGGVCYYLSLVAVYLHPVLRGCLSVCLSYNTTTLNRKQKGGRLGACSGPDTAQSATHFAVVAVPRLEPVTALDGFRCRANRYS